MKEYTYSKSKAFLFFSVAFLLIISSCTPDKTNSLSPSIDPLPTPNVESPTASLESPTPPVESPSPSPMPTGEVKQYDYGDSLSIEITNVAYEETRTGIHDGLEEYEYLTYVLYPGAEITVLHAEMKDSSSTDSGKSRPNWYITTKYGGDVLPLIDGMDPVTLTPDMSGITEETYHILSFDHSLYSED